MIHCEHVLDVDGDGGQSPQDKRLSGRIAGERLRGIACSLTDYGNDRDEGGS